MPSWQPVQVPRFSRAGYLFGTTRTRQPGVLGCVFLSRRAHTSGGVMASLPAQNGQRSDRAKWFRAPGWRGRLSLSGAMITERPVTGSFLNSDMGETGRPSSRMAVGVREKAFSAEIKLGRAPARRLGFGSLHERKIPLESGGEAMQIAADKTFYQQRAAGT